MATMRSKFGNSLMKSYNQATRASKFVQKSLTKHLCCSDGDLTGVWLKRLGAGAVTDRSRDAHAQLSSILDYYNVGDASEKARAVSTYNQQPP